ncbi:MAG: hypothetical protein M1834_002386 [Cirrosporium novae-zelandiae]|nr:MAG: hypothetical protein M1834_002386 [Cirrosporium novae-zelandiae]
MAKVLIAVRNVKMAEFHPETNLFYLYQKASKQLAARNIATLSRMHIISLCLNSTFVILRLLFSYLFGSKTSYLTYILLSAPAFLIEFWFEKIGRPKIGDHGEPVKTGEDLEAKGLTEYLWDVLYWTWGCTGVAALFGNKGWWLWIVIPLYSIWSAYTTYTGMSQGMAGLAGASGDGSVQAESNRQRKMEKRGGQRMQYR